MVNVGSLGVFAYLLLHLPGKVILTTESRRFAGTQVAEQLFIGALAVSGRCPHLASVCAAGHCRRTPAVVVQP